jgi:putative ABC transport system permease protein
VQALIWSYLRQGWWRSVAVAALIAAAAVSFVLVAEASKTTDIRVRGTVRSSYAAAYDILVRPRGSQTALERTRRLVANNALGALFGGIAVSQYQRILQIEGVQVAAPVANIGYVIPYAVPTVPLKEALNGRRQLLRIVFESVADGGTSHYPDTTSYVYVDPQGDFRRSGSGATTVTHGMSTRTLRLCGAATELVASPFAQPGYVDCDSGGRSPILIGAQVWLPILLAAIDPDAEDQLVHLGRAVVAGRYLREGERPRLQLLKAPGRTFHRLVPVIASTRTYIDESLVAHVERLSTPSSAALQDLIATGTPKALDRLPGREIARTVVSAQASYRQALAGVFGKQTSQNISWSYWTGSPVRYESAGDTVSPLPVANLPSVFSGSVGGSTRSYQAPPASGDLSFQTLHPRIGSRDWSARSGGLVLDTPVMDIVGRYNPAKLPGFSPLSKVPMGTYYPPELVPASGATRAILHGRPLLPSANIAGYVSQPPLFLTTLRGMEAFLDPANYAGANAAAPISLIRIRVRGANGPDALSQARIRAVATAIHDQTNLQVDVTAGSSPTSVRVALPAGRFGRPRLLLEEIWSKKGASVSFLRSLDRKRLALLVLSLLSCIVCVGGAAHAAVRTRLNALGILRCVGWSAGNIFVAVVAELLAIGVAAGTLGFVAATVIQLAASLGFSMVRDAMVFPVAAGMALLGGSLPAWSATRMTPMEALADRPRSSAARAAAATIGAMVRGNLRATPTRYVVGGLGLFVASGVVTLLVGIDTAFRGELVGTLLGAAVSLKVRGLDFLTVGVIAVLGSIALFNMILMDLRERRAELSTLRTIGWTDRQVFHLVSVQATSVAALAASAGVVVGGTIGLALGISVGKMLLTSVMSVAGAACIAPIASAVALAKERAIRLPAALQGR